MTFHLHRTDVWTSRTLTPEELGRIQDLVMEMLGEGRKQAVIMDLSVERDFEDFRPISLKRAKELGLI